MVDVDSDTITSLLGAGSEIGVTIGGGVAFYLKSKSAARNKRAKEAMDAIPLRQVELPEPIESHDTFWFDLIGIPIDVWCSMGKSHGPEEFELHDDAMRYLRRRREQGDFKQPVDLVKKPKVTVPPTFAGEHCPKCGAGMTRAVTGFLQCKFCNFWVNGVTESRDKNGKPVLLNKDSRYTKWYNEYVYFSTTIESTDKEWVLGVHGNQVDNAIIRWKNDHRNHTAFDGRYIGDYPRVITCRPCGERLKYWKEVENPKQIEIALLKEPPVKATKTYPSRKGVDHVVEGVMVNGKFIPRSTAGSNYITSVTNGKGA